MNRALLTSILSQPAAPFREECVARRVAEALDAGSVPWFRDPAGNVVIGVSSRKAYQARVRRASREPLRVFVAHMDHPGFHGARWVSDTELAFRWHGGSPVKHLEGAPVWLADGAGLFAEGEIASATLDATGHAMVAGGLRVPASLRARARKAGALFGGFRFRAPVWREGPLVHTKAADDLVGAFVVLSLALELHRRKRPERENFLGLLTRAEEVGFVGCLAHLDLGWLGKARRRVVGVSLETSRTFPGALVGKGPVVRLGDRATTFDPGSLQVLTELARRKLPGRHQRRIMDGGTCEATALIACGHAAIALSVPLGNYHNQSFEGGPDSRGELGPAPELVHEGDIEGMLTLCRGLMAPGLRWEKPWARKAGELRRRARRYHELL